VTTLVLGVKSILRERNGAVPGVAAEVRRDDDFGDDDNAEDDKFVEDDIFGEDDKLKATARQLDSA